MRPENIEAFSQIASDLVEAQRHYDSGNVYILEAYEQLTEYERFEAGEAAYQQTQLILSKLFEQAESEQITEDFVANDSNENSFVVRERQLDTIRFGTIYIEKTRYFSDDSEDLLDEFRAGFMPLDYLDEELPFAVLSKVSFVPHMTKWDEEELFVWVYDGLETIMQISSEFDRSKAAAQQEAEEV